MAHIDDRIRRLCAEVGVDLDGQDEDARVLLAYSSLLWHCRLLAVTLKLTAVERARVMDGLLAHWPRSE